MKRFIQIVAVVVAAILVAQPALANAFCPPQVCGSGASASNCCQHAGDMPMPGMSSDDAMSSMDTMSSTGAGCLAMGHAALSESGCMAELPCASPARSSDQLTSSAQRRIAGIVDVDVLPQAGAEILPSRALRIVGATPAPASAKYILFHVFRI